ncbi:MAG: NADH-quinone oxidoreductase subunit C [Actinobacteria bacterium]|nr:NADH-quinone oxidoreductase subunit C [Actinomycetota bacterium]
MSEAAADATADLVAAVKILPEFRGETSWEVPKDRLVELMTALKKEGMTYLVDITAVDNQGEDPRFEVVYELCDLANRKHLRIKTRTVEGEPVPSVCSVWKGADWHERDMWDGYPHHPLRKDFPLEGLPTEMPDIAFTAKAPLEGGPFVTSPAPFSHEREPRARPAEEGSL